MEKQLVAIGNSVGVVIDRALCRVLEVRRGSRVRISTDGQRLLITPVREEKKLPALELVDLNAIVETLVYSDIPDTAIAKLHPGLRPVRNHAQAMAWSALLKDDASAEDREYARRFRVVYDQVRGGATWDQAVAAALACGG